jgi:hypothetical protein
MGHFVFTLDKDDVDSATRCLQLWQWTVPRT